MRLLFASHTPYVGGAELALLDLVRGIRKSCGASVYVTLPSKGPLEARLIEAGATTLIIPYVWWATSSLFRDSPAKRFSRVLRNCATAGQLAVLIHNVRPDVVITNTITIVSAAIAAKINRTPHIWHIHEYGVLDHNLIFDLGESLCKRIVTLLSDEIIVNSNAVSSEFCRSENHDKLRTIYYGIDIPDVPRTLELDNAFTAVLVGYKSPMKGQDDAIRAVALLRERGVDVKLALVGGGSIDYVETLKQTCYSLGVSDLVCFADFTENPYEHYVNSHVALMCSKNEAFGRVTVEAMKVGLPVIGTQRGGTAELIRDNFNGLKYNPGDAEDLANRIQYLYLNPELREQMGSNARGWATSTFSMSNYVESFLNSVRRVLRDRA